MYEDGEEEGRLCYKQQGHPDEPRAENSELRIMMRYIYRELKLSVGEKG